MNKSIPFRVVALKVENFRISEKTLRTDSQVEVRTTYAFGVSVADHLVMARLSYTYLQEGDELLQMTLLSTFDVRPDAFKTMHKEGKFIIEPFFSQYLSTINVGAARGEIHARCEQAKSELANVILPPINLAEALPDGIEIAV